MKFLRRAGLAAVLLLALQRAFAADVTDDRGQRSAWPQPPQRIVSLLPSVTESVCALGACGRLVGVDNYSNWPAQVAALPHVGGLEDANVERIVSLRPDVVLLSRSARVTGRLEALGVRVLAFEPDSLADMQRVLGQLGALLGRQAQAEALWRDMDAGVAKAAVGIPAQARGQRVYFEVESAPYAAGESSVDPIIYDRVEIVRGATGLRTGAGNPSASINLVRKHADSREFKADLSAGVGNWDTYRVTADLSSPLNASGSVRGRIVSAYQDNHSFLDYYQSQKKVFYGVVDADLGSRTTLSVGYNYQDNDPQGSSWGGFPLGYADGGRTYWVPDI